MNLNTSRLNMGFIDESDVDQLIVHLTNWEDELKQARTKHNRHPGLKGLLGWVERTKKRLTDAEEPLDDTKTRIREFLGRLHMLEGLPLDL